MCAALLAGAVVGFCSRVRKSRQGRERREKGLKVVLKWVMVWTGIVILDFVFSFI